MSLSIVSPITSRRVLQPFTILTYLSCSRLQNPKDPQIFASACLDHTIKVWSLGSPTPNFTLEDAHQKGVNSVDYYHGGDKPFLISCGDER
jgi:coatomer subunit beta'